MKSRVGAKKYLSVDDIRKRMADYCVYRDRSIWETGQKLDQYHLKPEVKDDIMAFLIEHGFLDDLRFAQSYARGKFYNNRWGRHKIIQGLRRHRLTDYYIRKGLEEIPDEDYTATVRGLIEKKCRSLPDGDHLHKQKKVSAYLLGKGYGYDEFKTILNEICQEH